MPNANYQRGRRLEYDAAAALEADGYLVMRAPGSKGCADLIALKRGEVLLVQCKTDGYLTPDERAELFGAARLVGAVPLSARWVKDGRAARKVWFAELVSTDSARSGGERAWTADHAMALAPGGRHHRPREVPCAP